MEAVSYTHLVSNHFRILFIADIHQHKTHIGIRQIDVYKRQNEYRESFYKQCKLYSYTENTITDRQTLNEELALTRARGYAKDTCEVRSGLCCISAPIFNAERHLAAAVSITGPMDFIVPNESKLIQDVITLGQLITFRIGGIGEYSAAPHPTTY